MKTNPYDGRYRRSSYWGEEPTTIARRLVEYLPLLKGAFPSERIRIVDLGCGDGRDAIYYAQQGIEVTGVDSSGTGLAQLREKADRAGLGSSVQYVQGDLVRYKLDCDYHAIVSSAALHCAPPEIRSSLFEEYKGRILGGGLFACTVIVEKPFVPAAPDAERGVSLLRSGEILGYLWDWEILWFVEEVKDCRSSGVPHKHVFDRVIARKV